MDKKPVTEYSFVGCKVTTGKFTMALGPQEKAEFKFMHKIINQVEKR